MRVSSYLDSAQELIEFRNLNRDSVRDRAYFDWRYQTRPCVAAPIIVWAEQSGRHVGALSVFPHDYHVLDKEYPIGVLGDISVIEECRGQGVGGAMFQFLAQLDSIKKLHGCLVLPNEQAARPLMKAGWNEVQRIGRRVKLLDVSSRIDRWLGPTLGNMIAWPMNRALELASFEHLYRRRSTFTAAVLTRFDERFDRLWQNTDKRGRVIGVRSLAYLRWRYERHPLNIYKVFALLEGDELHGYAVYRVDGSVCHVDDIFYRGSEGCVATLLSMLMKRLREESTASSVVVNINESVFAFPWRRFGFVRRADFQHVLTADGGADNALTAARHAGWHVTAGDKDV